MNTHRVLAHLVRDLYTAANIETLAKPPFQSEYEMNKHQVLSKLADLEQSAANIEAQMRELRSILQAPDSLLTKPEPGSRADYWQLEDGFGKGFVAQELEAASKDPDYYNHGNIFQSKELAANYAKAINTLLLLRHQPGTVQPQPGVDQFVIEPDWDNTSSGLSIRCSSSSQMRVKMTRLSPCFATLQDAERAIFAIGEEQLLHMFKTLHHVE